MCGGFSIYLQQTTMNYHTTTGQARPGNPVGRWSRRTVLFVSRHIHTVSAIILIITIGHGRRQTALSLRIKDCQQHQLHRSPGLQWELALRALGPHQQSLTQLDQEASREASLEIFRWFVINGECSPPEKIYNDELLESLEDEEDSEDEDQLDNVDFKTVQEEKQDGLEKWLDTI